MLELAQALIWLLQRMSEETRVVQMSAVASAGFVYFASSAGLTV